MSRFGVMKHLRVLEEAGLVTTRRRGREKLHFLNPVPIRLIHDRWVGKYAEPWASALSEPQTRNRGARTMHEEFDVPQARSSRFGGRGTMTVFEIYIKTTPERLWEAITDRRCSAKYSFGVEHDLRLDTGLGLPGRGPGRDRHRRAARTSRSTRRGRLVQSFNALWSDEVKGEGTSRVTWEIERSATPAGSRSPTTSSPTTPTATYGGWPMILSGLKTLLETGELLTRPVRCATPARRAA